VSRARARPVDLRSDTVTTPTQAMRRAMADAEVGDDVYAEDPTVKHLEEKLAAMVGMEAGLFVPSGTMSNQIALAVHCRRGSEAIMPEGAHIYEYEPGAMAVISGVLPRLVRAPGGAPSPDDVRASVKRSVHQAPTDLITLENTHNGAGGAVVSLEAQRQIQQVARDEKLPIHLDGARAFNAAAALGVPIGDVCAGFDSVSICLSKGLGAPVGSVLLGCRRFIGVADRYSNLLGGGMRQAGVLAAAALVALEVMPSQLKHDHERARRLALALVQVPGLSLDLDSVQSNMIYLTVLAGTQQPGGSAAWFSAACAEQGVRFNPVDATRVRLVTHHQVDDAQLQRAIDVLTQAASAPAAQP
jgi:threonine aldolase